MAFLKLYIESYFDLAMCSALAALAMMEIPLGQSFKSLFENPDDAMNNGFTMIYSVLVLLTPYIGYKIIVNNLGNL
jgi:amino acid permease